MVTAAKVGQVRTHFHTQQLICWLAKQDLTQGTTLDCLYLTLEADLCQNESTSCRSAVIQMPCDSVVLLCRDWETSSDEGKHSRCHWLGLAL